MRWMLRISSVPCIWNPPIQGGNLTHVEKQAVRSVVVGTRVPERDAGGGGVVSTLHGEHGQRHRDVPSAPARSGGSAEAANQRDAGKAQARRGPGRKH